MSSLQLQMNTLAKWCIRFLLLACVLVVALDSVVDTHPHFEIEHSYAFYAWYGFVGCIGLVLASKAMRVVLKRKENYYDK